MEVELKSLIGSLSKPNHNGRVYDKNTFEDALNRWKENGNKFVSIGRPDIASFGEVPLQKVAGIVKDVWIDGDEVYGKIELYDTTNGKVITELINSGYNFALSPRMTGELKPVCDEDGNPELDENGKQFQEVKDLNIISFNIIGVKEDGITAL